MSGRGSHHAARRPAVEPKHYKADTITEIKEYEGPHLLPAGDGWEEIADYALDWALRTCRRCDATRAVDAVSDDRRSASPTSAAPPR